MLKSEEELQMEIMREQQMMQEQQAMQQQMAMAQTEETLSKAQSNRASAEATLLSAGEPI